MTWEPLTSTVKRALLYILLQPRAQFVVNVETSAADNVLIFDQTLGRFHAELFPTSGSFGSAVQSADLLVIQLCRVTWFLVNL